MSVFVVCVLVELSWHFATRQLGEWKHVHCFGNTWTHTVSISLSHSVSHKHAHFKTFRNPYLAHGDSLTWIHTHTRKRSEPTQAHNGRKVWKANRAIASFHVPQQKAPTYNCTEGGVWLLYHLWWMQACNRIGGGLTLRQSEYTSVDRVHCSSGFLSRFPFAPLVFSCLCLFLCGWLLF